MNRRQLLGAAIAIPFVGASDGLSPIALPRGDYQPLDPSLTPLLPIASFNETRLKEAMRACWKNDPQPNFIIINDGSAALWWQ
jgi:hypothetical protein